MMLGRSRGRVAAAVVAALLAGVLLAWLTRPSAAARPAAAADRVPTNVITPAPDGPVPDPAGPSGRRTTSAAPPVGATPAATPRSAAKPRPAAPAAPAAPTRLEIPRLDVKMSIQPVGVAGDGEMALPGDPADLGWYAYGPRPGDAEGATVLAAHLDYPGYGTGPLAAAEELPSRRHPHRPLGVDPAPVCRDVRAPRREEEPRPRLALREGRARPAAHRHVRR